MAKAYNPGAYPGEVFPIRFTISASDADKAARFVKFVELAIYQLMQETNLVNEMYIDNVGHTFNDWLPDGYPLENDYDLTITIKKVEEESQ